MIQYQLFIFLGYGFFFFYINFLFFLHSIPMGIYFLRKVYTFLLSSKNYSEFYSQRCNFTFTSISVKETRKNVLFEKNI